MKLLPRVLADDEETSEEEFELEAVAPHTQPLSWRWTVALCLGAALPRLLYLFGLTDPENPGIRRYGDVWHHWQIAYLTKEIGRGLSFADNLVQLRAKLRSILMTMDLHRMLRRGVDQLIRAVG